MSTVPFEAETWGTPIEHEPEHIPEIPADLRGFDFDIRLGEVCEDIHDILYMLRIISLAEYLLETPL